MRRSVLLPILATLLLVVVFLCGCMDSKDIHEKLFSTIICCDYKDGEVWFYAEFSNIEQSQNNDASGGSVQGEKYILIKGHGKTIPEARLDLDLQMDKPLYLSGVRTLLLTERFAEKYLLEYLFRLRADETYRKKVITITTLDDLDEIFTALHARDLSVGFAIEHLIETLGESGECFSRSTSRILENLASNYCGILIPSIELNDEEIKLAGYSVVHGPAVVDFIPVEESKGLILFKADKPIAHYTIPYRGIQFTIQTSMNERNIEAFYADGSINFTVSLSFDAFVEYGNVKTPYNIDKTAIFDMQTMLQVMIEQDVRTAVDQAQKTYQIDYLQMDDAFRIRYPVQFEAMDWETVFLDAVIDVEIEVDLRENPMMDYGANETK